MSVTSLHEWTAEHKEEYAAYKSQYKKDNKEANRASVRAYIKRLRTAVLDLLGNKCIKCGFSDARALQVDHINGGGNQERRQVGPHGIFRRVLALDNPHNEYQLLCANCNWIKKHENEEHA